MRKIITFLGMNSFQTCYQYRAQVYEGEVFPKVLRQFETFDQMLVCLTAGARQKTWHLLEALQDDRIIPIDIPDGRNEAEIWTTFQEVIQHIGQDDQVIFDITHGLRSLPFQVFLFAAYLKAAKNAFIEAIYYGAFDLKDDNGIAPVIDLSSFVTMLDWLTATDRFTKLGDGQALASLIQQPISDKEMRQVPAVKRMGEQLENAASAIKTISLALAVTRPEEVIAAATQLNRAVDAAEKSLDAKVKPFALVQEQVKTAYGQFAVSSSANQQQRLQKQFDMIGWYLERQQIVQAVTLAREWIVSVYCWKFGAPLNDKQSRDDIAQALNNLKYSQAKTSKFSSHKQSRYDQRICSENNSRDVNNIWKEMAKIRNEIAHCGMSRPMDHQINHQGKQSTNNSAIALCDRVNRLYPKLKEQIATLLH